MKILFQGDSITDCGRNRADNNSVGNGYPLLIKGRLALDCAGIEFMNRGVSGDRIVDVYARRKRDIINLQPDCLSLLIGVNDVWHEMDIHNGVDTDEFIFFYDRLLTQVKEALPNIKILLLEPYVLENTATKNTPEQPDRWQRFRSDVEAKAAAVKAIAAKHGCTFVPLQEQMDEAAARLGVDTLTLDGVHPQPAGHQLIADAWLAAWNA